MSVEVLLLMFFRMHAEMADLHTYRAISREGGTLCK